MIVYVVVAKNYPYLAGIYSAETKAKVASNRYPFQSFIVGIEIDHNLWDPQLELINFRDHLDEDNFRRLIPP